MTSTGANALGMMFRDTRAGGQTQARALRRKRDRDPLQHRGAKRARSPSALRPSGRYTRNFMRRFLTALAAVLSGCGYVAGPLPPLANIPARVTDLAAVQRGGKLIVQFTVPQLTTEGVTIKQSPSFDLRIGPGPDPFSGPQWASEAKRIQIGRASCRRTR